MPRPTRRDDVLQAAAARFYRDGITATGVDTVIRDAGVAKMTLYGNFASKDDLVVAYLQQRDQRFFDRLDADLVRCNSPIERALAPVALYRHYLDEDGFHGCAFVNAAAELGTDHPAHQIITRHKTHLLHRWTQLIADLNTDNPHHHATECFLLLEGAFVHTGLGLDRDLFDTTETLIRDRLTGLAATPHT